MLTARQHQHWHRSRRCALDTAPHPDVGSSSSMLGNLANMAARELDGQPPPTEAPAEFVVRGTSVPPVFRTRLNAYCWTTVLLDVRSGKWPILFINAAFRAMTGADPLPCEGGVQCMWKRVGVADVIGW